jgi:hypothetical protein
VSRVGQCFWSSLVSLWGCYPTWMLKAPMVEWRLGEAELEHEVLRSKVVCLHSESVWACGESVVVGRSDMDMGVK